MITRPGARGALVTLTAIVIAGCGFLPGLAAGPGPAAAARPCVAVYPADRCDAMLTAAAEQLGVADDDVTAIEIAPDPTPRADGILETLGGARQIRVLADVGGNVREVGMCGGLPSGPACNDVPTLEIGSAIRGGYRDVPCAGEPPEGCATPLPRLEPDAVEHAQQLRIDERSIAIPRVGPQEVLLGTAALPNGVLTVARAELADAWPDGVRFSSLGLQLVVRSLDAGRPAFTNLYEHGWWPGTEEVEVFLVFDVRHVVAGASIVIRNVVVG